MLTELEAHAKAAELSKTSHYPVSVWFADAANGWDYGIMETGSGANKLVTPYAQLSGARQRDKLGFENSSHSRRNSNDTATALASWLCGLER